MTLLNLAKLPEVESSIGLLAFNHMERFSLVNGLGDVSERILGTYLLMNYHRIEKYSAIQGCVYFRAAVNEFVSISEVIKHSPDPKIRDLTIELSDFPLFHFFKLLRTVNFHLKSLSHEIIKARANLIDSITNEIDLKDFELSHQIISDCNISMFDKTRAINHYKRDQLTEVLDWIDENQRRWGIFYLLDLALRQYCAEIEKLRLT